MSLREVPKKSGIGPEFFVVLNELLSDALEGAELKNKDGSTCFFEVVEFKSNRTEPGAGSFAGVVVIAPFSSL